MKNIFSFIVLQFILFPAIVYSQSLFQTSVEDTTLADEDIDFQSVMALADGNFLVAGTWTGGAQTYYNNGLLSKINSSGEVLWSMNYSTYNYTRLHTMSSRQGGFYLGGNTYSGDALILKTDTLGNVESTFAVGDSGTWLDVSAITKQNDIYLVCGSGSSASGPALIFYFQFDSDNVVHNFHRYVFNDNMPYTINTILGDDSVIYLLGSHPEGATGQYSGFVLKCGIDGSIIWAKKIKAFSHDVFKIRDGVISLNHELTLICEIRAQLGTYYTRQMLLRLDSNGNILWNRSYSDSNAHLYSSKLLQINGNFIVAGSYQPFPEENQAALYKYDSAGNNLWALSFNPDPNITIPYAITSCQDAGFLLAGGQSEYSSHPASVIKTDSAGHSCYENTLGLDEVILNPFASDISAITVETNYSLTIPLVSTVANHLLNNGYCSVSQVVNEISATSELVFPNPFSDYFLIENRDRDIHSIQLFNSIGELISRVDDVKQSYKMGDLLNPGIYFLILHKTNSVNTIKVVKQ